MKKKKKAVKEERETVNSKLADLNPIITVNVNESNTPI